MTTVEGQEYINRLFKDLCKKYSVMQMLELIKKRSDDPIIERIIELSLRRYGVRDFDVRSLVDLPNVGVRVQAPIHGTIDKYVSDLETYANYKFTDRILDLAGNPNEIGVVFVSLDNVVLLGFLEDRRVVVLGHCNPDIPLLVANVKKKRFALIE